MLTLIYIFDKKCGLQNIANTVNNLTLFRVFLNLIFFKVQSLVTIRLRYIKPLIVLHC
jgi:hypothetical protein